MARRLDILNDMIERMLAADPNIEISTADRVLYSMRIDYGGHRMKIPSLPAEQAALRERLGLVDPDPEPRYKVCRKSGGQLR